MQRERGDYLLAEIDYRVASLILKPFNGLSTSGNLCGSAAEVGAVVGNTLPKRLVGANEDLLTRDRVER